MSYCSLASRLCTLATGAFLACSAHAGTRYLVTDLGTLGGPESDGASINSGGHVVGSSNTAVDAPFRAFLHDGTQMVDLGGLTVDGESHATSVNAKGHACGWAIAKDGTTHAVLYADGGVTDVNKASKLFVQSQCNGIDRKSYMVGTALLADGQYHAFLNVQDHYKTLDAGSQGLGLNDKGAAVGTMQNKGVLFNQGATNPLGTLGGSWSEGDAVNNDNLVTGWAATKHDAEAHAFLWNNNKILDLGTLTGGTQSQGLAINSKAVVVGWSATDGTNAKHAFKASAKNAMVDLNKVMDKVTGQGWTLVVATGINPAGEITGTGEIDGAVHAFKLTPMK